MLPVLSLGISNGSICHRKEVIILLKDTSDFDTNLLSPFISALQGIVHKT